MPKEIEARFINLSKEKILEKLTGAGAGKIGDFFYQEWIFAHPEWKDNHRRIRIRTDGKKIWLTYKANPAWDIDSTEEIETEVSSLENTIEFIKSIGVPLVRYQEKKRIRYNLNDIIFELDFWPQIPMVLEIEAQTVEKVKEGADFLELNWDNAIFVDQKVLHQEYYGINLDAIKNYKFIE